MELNLPNNFKYKNIEISSNLRYCDNSLLNIIDNFIFRHLEMPYSDIRKGLILGNKFILDTLSELSKNVRGKFRGVNKDHKRFLIMYLMLESLNNYFNLKIKKLKQLNGINYPDNFNHNYKTIDEICYQYYEDYTLSKNKILERDLENYIFKNGIFDIKIIKRQYKLKNGIIDLLGIDSKGKNVIIELKVIDKPRDLLWQIKLYQNELKHNLKTDNFRTIVICPGLDETIKQLLPSNVEIIFFNKTKTKFNFKIIS